MGVDSHDSLPCLAPRLSKKDLTSYEIRPMATPSGLRIYALIDSRGPKSERSRRHFIIRGGAGRWLGWNPTVNKREQTPSARRRSTTSTSPDQWQLSSNLFHVSIVNFVRSAYVSSTLLTRPNLYSDRPISNY